MATIPEFTKVPPTNVVFQPIRVNEGGKGKTVYLDVTPLGGGKPSIASRSFAGPKDMRVAWAVRPKMDITDPKKLTDFEKFDLELELDPERHADFVAHANAYDTHVLQTAFEKRAEWFGKDKAEDITDPRMLKMNYKPIVHKGKERKGGSGGFYNSTIKLKLEKQARRVKEFVLETKEIKGKPTSVVKDVVWEPRLVDGSPPPDPNEPRFFLCYGKDPVTGVDQYTSKVPLIASNGSILRDAAGKPVMRYVGPEDIKRGATVFPVFTINKIYVVESFGPMLTTTQVYIKPAPAREQPKVDNANVVDEVDPEISARALGGSGDAGSATMEDDFPEFPEDDDALPTAPITVALDQATGGGGGGGGGGSVDVATADDDKGSPKPSKRKSESGDKEHKDKDKEHKKKHRKNEE